MYRCLWCTSTSYVLVFVVFVCLDSITNGDASPTINVVKSNWNTTSCPKQCTCRMRPSDVSHHANLKTANCSYRNFKTIPTDLSRDIESLDVIGNSLRDIYDQVPDLLELKELDASKNQIRSLGRGYIFHKLSSLTYLNLAKNELTSVIRDVFFGLSSLQVLILTDNKISFIEDQAFHGLTSLQILDLGRNQLASLYPEWFYGLASLNELYVYENRIHSINSATFRPLARLRHLSLHGNRINHVSDDGFWGLDAVDTLHLERNNLRTIPTKALQYLIGLQHLYLSGNPVERIGTGDVSDLSSVEELVLNNMPSLILVDALAFSNLNRLHTLQMKNCPKLAYIDPQAFVNMSSLHSLMLQHDRLMALPVEVSKALPVSAEIELRGNPLLCDCNVRWIRKAMELTNRSRVSFADGDDIKCEKPDNMHDIPVRHIDFTAPSKSCQPSIAPLTDSTIIKSIGEPLVLDCRAFGIPTPRLKWHLLGDNKIASINDVRLFQTSSGTLKIYHLKEEDSGVYCCIADNGYGTSSINVSIEVDRIDIHLFPTVISSNFVTVVWNGTARKNFSQVKLLYRVFYVASDGSKSCDVANTRGVTDEVMKSNTNETAFKQVNVRASRFDYTIGNLLPMTAYEFCVAYEETGGYCVTLSCTVATTRDADYMRQGITRTTSVVDVLIVMAVFVLIGIVLCLAIIVGQKYRQRQYVCPDKHVAYRMSHIPLENLYSPLMSNVGP